MRRLLTSLLLVCVVLRAAGFKENEFKKCKDAGFCRRNRGIAGPKFGIVADTLNVQGSELKASLRNEAAGKDLRLMLKAYSHGFVRLTVDEDEEVGRYKITDMTPPGLESNTLDFHVAKQDSKEISLTAGDAQVTIIYEPFKLTVAVKGKPAVVLNGRGLFNFEHRRPKEEGVECDGCWDETFLQFKDSKPLGPEAISLDISFPGFDHVYGIPEHATSFALKPTPASSEPYRLYNLDVFEYLESSPFGLYGSIPMLVAHKVGLTTGVLWLNAAEMYVDIAKAGGGTASQWIAESGIVDLFVFVGPKPADVQRQYAAVTGTTALPQMFAIGYHQCRWNYKDEADVFKVDDGFDEHAIPYDVLWLDIEHTDGKRYLTWDNQHFPQPVEMQEEVAAGGRKMVTIVDPHVKRDGSYYVFSEAQAAGYFVKTAQSTDFEGWCWPGSSTYLDVTSAEVRDWWAQQFTLDKYKGSTKHLYIWNDMNEPSVFNGPEITMQKDLLHGGQVEHRNVHNLYGLYYHMATAEGLKLRGQQLHNDGDRPFVLSRAFFSGTQRVGPIWTGDNMANWEHLRVSIPMLLSLGVTGLTFSGADVGGFFGNPDAELLTRWYQVGIYYPFFRGHAHLETARREPWLFGEETTTHIRNAIRGRYALLPYMYTLFRHANTTGQPVLRPLWYEFPDDKPTFAVEQEFMVGPAMLVRPVLQPGASSVDTLLPHGSRWFCAHTGEEMDKLRTTLPRKLQVNITRIPVFYRGGYIIPRRERPRRSTQTQARDPFTLVIALDEGIMAAAAGDLYLDDGHSFAFQRGQYIHRRFSFKGFTLNNKPYKTKSLGVPKGRWAGAKGLVIERVVFLGLPKTRYGYAALLPDGKVAHLELGPLNPASNATDHYILRKPNLAVDEDWSVDLAAKPPPAEKKEKEEKKGKEGKNDKKAKKA